MGAAELTQPRALRRAAALVGRGHGRRITLTYAGLWALTGLGTAIGAAVPGLTPGRSPHPALHGTLCELAAIAAVNAGTLSAPFLLALLGFPEHGSSRRAGAPGFSALPLSPTKLIGWPGAPGFQRSPLSPTEADRVAPNTTCQSMQQS